MPRPKKEAGSLTGSQRVKDTAAKKTTTKVKTAIENGASKLKDTATNAVLGVPGMMLDVTPQVVNKVTDTIAKTGQAATDLRQLGQAIAPKGFTGNLTYIGETSDPYGGLKIPEFDAQSFVPNDLTNPSNLASYQLSEEEYQQAAKLYAGAGRYLGALELGYQHLQKVGKVIQANGKAKQSIVKGATEQVKLTDETIKYDTAVVNMHSSLEKRDQAVETLKQNQAKTLGAINETHQTIRLIEAKENKREADIKALETKTEQVISKYLSDSASISLQPSN